MAIATVTQRNTLVDAYKAAAAFMTVQTTTAAATAGTEVTGGAPAFARKASNWGATSASAATAAPVAFDIPASTTVQSIAFYTLVSAGVFLDSAAITSQTFASQGTLTVTATYTQT